MKKHSDTPAVMDYFLRPGFIYLPEKPTVISTVLGSSVSVGLYDKRLKTGGMYHFLFPRANAGEKATALYGNIAVPVLIKMMMENGSQRAHLEAQIFGGAFNTEASAMDIGRDNFRTARQILDRKRIRVVSEDVGGSIGRKVVFNTNSYEIGILKVNRLRDSDWYPYDGDR